MCLRFCRTISMRRGLCLTAYVPSGFTHVKRDRRHLRSRQCARPRPDYQGGGPYGQGREAREEDDLINPLSHNELGEGGTSHVAASNQFSRATRDRSARPMRPPS